jgi:hypothetical protein
MRKLAGEIYFDVSSIPSYTHEELALYSETFGLNVEKLTARCFEIGPLLFRYIIADDNNFA